MGIRKAVGAAERDVLRLVLVRVLVQASIGVSLGVPAAWALTQLLRNLLYRVAPTDARARFQSPTAPILRRGLVQEKAMKPAAR